MEDNIEIKESILAGYPNVIPYECAKSIIKQMEKNICKFKINNEQSTGFFCQIPFPTKEKLLPVFITNNHSINENILFSKDALISLDIKENKDLMKINLNDRLKYTSEEYDTTIIEIKEKDNIKNFLELDDNIIKDIIENDNENKDFIDKTVYIIQYPEGELSVSYGVLQSILEDKKYEFNHKCSTKGGSSGSPILNLKNNKIIGIHKSGIKKNLNKGSFLNFPIKEFIKNEFESKKKPPFPPLTYRPPLIGLKNIGAYCFMNATLQCLSQIEPLVNFFKNDKKVNNTIEKYKIYKEDCLTESFKILIDNLWPDNYHNLPKNSHNYYYAPYEFKEKISKMNPLFQGVQAINDEAKDLLNFIIMTLHDELNEKQNQNNTNNNIQSNQNNKKLMLKNYMDSFNSA